MLKICKLLFIISFIFIPIAKANSSDFLGVGQYLNKYDKEIKKGDLYHFSGIFQRCAGVFGAYGKFLSTDQKEMKSKFINLSLQSMKKSMDFMNMSNKNKPELNLKQVNTAIYYFTSIYDESLKIAQRNTGSIMKGNASIDMKLCLGLFK